MLSQPILCHEQQDACSALSQCMHRVHIADVVHATKIIFVDATPSSSRHPEPCRVAQFDKLLCESEGGGGGGGGGRQGAHLEAVDMEANVDAQQDPEKLEAKRILNAKVSAYTLEAGVVIHRCLCAATSWPLSCYLP